MKKLGTLALVLTLTGITFVSIQGCKPKGGGGGSVAVKPVGESAEQTSFKEVTSKLDSGGNLYVYLGTEQWLKGLSAQVDKWHEMVASLPDAQDNIKVIDSAFNIGNNLIKDSGLQDISGIGISSIAREPGIYCNKMVVHHYPGQGNGFLWTIFGKQAHDLDGLNLLPANTAMAAFYDVDSAEIWSVIQKQCEQSGFPQAQEALKQFQDQFVKNAGIRWDEFIASLDGEIGMVVTLDDSHIVHIPIPNQQPLDMPEPALMFVVKVKNDAIFKRIDILMKQKGVPGVISSDKDGIQMRTVNVPVPSPITLRPTFAQSGGYFFFATSDALIQEAVAVKGGKAGLKSTEEFKKLSAGIPQQGNSLCFLSQRFGETIAKIQQQALNSNQQMPSQVKEFMNSFFANQSTFTYGVGANTDEGWITVANGNQGSGNILAASAVVPAVGAAMVLPALAKAKQRSQQIACINNLKLIELAKHQWAMEKKKSATAVPTLADLQPYLGNARGPLRCPQGGDYTVGAVGQPPTCSVPGHALPKDAQAQTSTRRPTGQ